MIQPASPGHNPMATPGPDNQYSKAWRFCFLVTLLCVVAYGFTFAPGAASQKRKQQTPKTGTPAPTPNQKGLGPAPPPPVLRKRVEEDNRSIDVISVQTSEVMMPVTVRDGNGRLVSDLTRNDFRVFEDSREQPLSELSLRQVPVDVILMVDSSSSVAANLDDFRRAAEQFAR